MTSTRPAPTLFRSFFPRHELHDQRLQAALDQLPGPAFLTVQRTGAIEAVNGKAAALTGWSRDELERQLVAEIVAAPDAAEALEEIHTLIAGQSRLLLNVPLRTRAGRPALVDLRLHAFAAAPANDVLLLIQAPPSDERTQAERHTTQHAQTLDSLEQLILLLAKPSDVLLDQAVELVRLMLGADAAGLYHVSPDQPGLRLHSPASAQPSFPARLGPSEAQYLRLPVRWSASQRPEGFLQQAARSAGWGHLLTQPVGQSPSLVGALCVAYRPGASIPTDAARLLSICALYLHQLTSQISLTAGFARARDLAVRLAEQLSAVHAQIEEGVVLIGRDGALEELNGAAGRLLGYRSEDVTGLPFGDVIIGDAAGAGLIQQCLDGEVPGGERDGRLLRRHGDSFPASLGVRALAQGGCVLTIRDLTAAADQERRLEQQDHMAFMGQATHSFAHEVRHPLQIISVGVQYLGDLLPNADGELARTLTSIQAECTRLSDLMTGMLAWAKPVQPTFEPVALEEVVEHLLHRFRAKLDRRNIRLIYTAASSLPPIHADVRLLEQVLTNLVDNALQAMPAGGQLMVDLGTARRPTGVVVEARIGDTGPGISEENRRRIFDPYFTTKADGNGLGLAICKRLITVHHGAIAVESFPGTGTIFTITLPAHPAPIAKDNPE